MLDGQAWWELVRDMQFDPALVLVEGVGVSPEAHVASSAVLQGPVYVAPGAKIEPFCHIQGPVHIGEGSIIGSYVKIRAGAYIGKRVQVGSYTEIKCSVVMDNCIIGAHCAIDDSYFDKGVWTGGLVRTSNMQIPGSGRTIRVMGSDGELFEPGMEKLGCYVGPRVKLSGGVGIMAGRAIPAGAVIPHRAVVLK